MRCAGSDRCSNGAGGAAAATAAAVVVADDKKELADRYANVRLADRILWSVHRQVRPLHHQPPTERESKESKCTQNEQKLKNFTFQGKAQKVGGCSKKRIAETFLVWI